MPRGGKHDPGGTWRRCYARSALMETRTHLFTFPIESDSDRTAVEEALQKLSTELALTHALRLKGGHRGLITVPDVDPETTWSAIDRVVPDWQQVFMPRSAA